MHTDRSVLVVDDDADNCANLKDILENSGYRADTAHDGPSALHMASRHSYNVAVLDFKMPGMDGATLCVALKHHYPEMVAIMVTASTEFDCEERAQAAGIWKLLRKPIDLRSLMQLVKDVIGE